MPPGSSPTPTAPPILVTRQILHTIGAGVLIFAVVAGYVVPHIDRNPRLQQILVSALLSLGLASAIAYPVLRSSLLRRLAPRREQARAQVAAGQVPPELFLLTLIGAGLAALFGVLACVTVVMGGRDVLLFAPLVSVGAILLLLPSAERLGRLLDASAEREP